MPPRGRRDSLRRAISEGYQRVLLHSAPTAWLRLQPDLTTHFGPQNWDELFNTSWFVALSFDDQYRAVHLLMHLAYLAGTSKEHVRVGALKVSRARLFRNTLGHLLADRVYLGFVDQVPEDDAHGALYGYAEGKCISLNRRFVDDSGLRHYAVGTLCHEVHHVIGHHRYDELSLRAEYSAFWVTCIAEQGRAPTRAECWEQLQVLLTDPAYATAAADAWKNDADEVDRLLRGIFDDARTVASVRGVLRQSRRPFLCTVPRGEETGPGPQALGLDNALLKGFSPPLRASAPR